MAVEKALAEVERSGSLPIPPYLQDAHYRGHEDLGRGIGYKYAHDYPNHWVDQQYLPDVLKNAHYYTFGDNKTEQAAAAYWSRIKSKL